MGRATKRDIVRGFKGCTVNTNLKNPCFSIVKWTVRHQFTETKRIFLLPRTKSLELFITKLEESIKKIIITYWWWCYDEDLWRKKREKYTVRLENFTDIDSKYMQMKKFDLTK